MINKPEHTFLVKKDGKNFSIELPGIVARLLAVKMNIDPYTCDAEAALEKVLENMAAKEHPILFRNRRDAEKRLLDIAVIKIAGSNLLKTANLYAMAYEKAEEGAS